MNRFAKAPHPVRRVAVAAALAAMHVGAAHAQTAADAATPPAPSASSSRAAPSVPAALAPLPAAPTAAVDAASPAPAPANTSDGLKLDAVIVTGTSSAKSKLNSSVSISTLDAEEVKRSGATSAAEVVRSVPGVRSESSGGESNANMTVRGLPLSAGGSRYLQLQEDGLPLLQIGDLNFITPDSYLRVDNALDHIEAIRGGTSATLATSAPGGIVNFISKTGSEQGGVGSLSLGTNNERRYELGYGGPLGPKTRFYIGGFYRTGEGARNGGVPIEDGGQLRANVTHELDNGYVRLYFKHLDDRSPTYLPLPISVDANGNPSAAPGFDLRTSSFHSPYWIPDQLLAGSNTYQSTNVNDGFRSTSSAIGFEAELNLAQGVKLQEKFRIARNGGRFLGIFAAGGATPAAAPGTTYLTGPNAGQPYTGATYNPVVFNTSLDNLSLTANDLRVAKTFGDPATGAVTTTGGIYTSSQRVAMTWGFNQYLTEATGNKPALLTAPGFTNGQPAFGACCQRIEDGTYTILAPYALVAWDQGPLNVDFSARNDRQKATGSFNNTAWNSDPTKYGLAYDYTRSQAMDYSVSRTSYSLGGNYKLSSNLAVFGRYSDGFAFNGNRISAGAGAGPGGSVVNNVDGSKVIPVNETKQLEAGVKWRAGGLSVFATAFSAKTDESNIDVTVQPAVLTATKYDARGVELEAAYRVGGFAVTGGATYTHARVTASSNAALVGTVPVRQATWIYQISPSYEVGDLSVGASFIGTTKAKENGVNIGDFVAVNAFANYQLNPHSTLALSVNNLTNVVGITESGGGNARAINGRTYKATVSYEF